MSQAMTLDRAYAILTTKAVDDDARVIEGIASTPTPDRLGDVVEPLGMKFSNPLPLLHQHDRRSPVGTVKFDPPTEDGVRFTARLPKIAEPGPLKDRVDTAWGEIKAGLVRAVSIGFKSIEMSFLDNGGIRFVETEIVELSLVTIPANAEATIQTIKSIDGDLRAASGREQAAVTKEQPGVTGSRKGAVSLATCKEPKMKTLSDQIAGLEAKRAANVARMDEIMTKAAEAGRSTDEAEQEEFDNLESEVATCDADLKRLKALQAMKAETAQPVTGVRTVETGSQQRAASHIVVRAPQLPPGIRFARVVKCVGMSRGNLMQAAQVAEHMYKDDGGIANVIKAAVAAGTSVHTTWASPLVGDETSIFADFVEWLRPQTILGRFGSGGIPSLRRVPFRTALVGQTSGGQGYWVGEAQAKPLTRFDFERRTLEPLKVANIAVITEELLRDSSPSAEMLVRDQLAAALRERIDVDFIDPAKGVAAGVSPASISNQITPIPSSGSDADAVRADIRAMFGAFIAANNAPTTGVWIMSAQMALALSLMVNPLGQAEFPGISMNGGTFSGLPVIASEYVPTDTDGSYVFLVNASDIYFADDGDIAVDMSREASLQMDDNPTGASDSPPVPAQMVSLWQTNSVGFRAERTLNWMRRRDSAVAVLNAVNWGAAPTSP